MGNKPLLSIEQRTLLDRLYNLKSEDSEILRQIREKIEQNKNDFRVLSDESSSLETQKDTLTTRRSDLDSQYSKILDDLKGMSRTSYETLLDEAHEEFDPEQMLERIKEKIPKRLEEIDEQIKTFENDISDTKKKISDNEIEATELEGKLADAIQMQERLAKLIDESLHGNGSITRDSVQDLLICVGFLEEETIELGKMILFPQGTLSEYNKEYEEKQNQGKSIQEVFGAAKAATAQEPLQDAEPTIEQHEEVEIQTTQEAEVTNDYQEFLNQTGLDSKYFSVECLEELKNSQQSELIKNNNEILKSLDISEKIVADYYTLLLDPELNGKIEFLQEIGKSSKDIELNISILLAYSLSDLQALNNACNEYGIEFGRLPLTHVAQYGLANLLTNLQELSAKGIELDKGEIEKFAASLFIEPEVFKNNLEVITKYQIILTKRNGKTAIQVLAQETSELINCIDGLIENNASCLLESNPEILKLNYKDLLNRIIYCQQNGYPIKKENGAVEDYIVDELMFASQFGMSTPKILCKSEKAHASLTNVTNNSPLVEALDTMDLNTLYTTGRNIEDEKMFFDIMNYTEGVSAKSEKVDNGFDFNGVIISKERFERNVIYLLNKGVNANEEEMLTVSLLYGTLKTEEEMKVVADKMGFNLPAVGGVEL